MHKTDEQTALDTKACSQLGSQRESLKISEAEVQCSTPSESLLLRRGGMPLTAVALLHLQRSVGNSGVVQLLVGQDEESPGFGVVDKRRGSLPDPVLQADVSERLGVDFAFQRQTPSAVQAGGAEADAGTAKKALSLSDNGAQLIAGFEGFVPELYDDVAGHCTIGYGHLVHLGNCSADPSKDTRGEQAFKDGITKERALELLKSDASIAENAVNDSVSVGLTQNQFDALVSFTYNVGSGSFGGSSLLIELNKKNYGKVPTELKKWDKAGGKESKGLGSRREKEAELWNTK